MKKTFLVSTMILTSSLMHAQFSVNKQGYVNIGRDYNQTSLSPLTIGSIGDEKSQFVIQTSANRPYGQYIENYPQSSAQGYGLVIDSKLKSDVSCTGISAFNVGNTNKSSIGVYSQIIGTPALGIAVRGEVSSGITKGAAIYGGIGPLFNTSGLFAGYFSGDVLATGKIYGTLLSSYPSQSITSQKSKNSDTKVSISTIDDAEILADKFCNLQLVKYNEPKFLTESINEVPDVDNSFSELKDYDSSNTDVYKKYVSQDAAKPYESVFKSSSDVRYALEINALAENFPEFVYEDADGNQCVDYIGMIPILVDCIGKLSARVDELEMINYDGVFKSAPNVTSEITGIEEEETLLVELAQNKPNPFDISTEISLSIPKSIESAKITVFDMNGKYIKSIPLEDRGSVKVTLRAMDFYKGLFLYSLIADGKVVDTKK